MCSLVSRFEDECDILLCRTLLMAGWRSSIGVSMDPLQANTWWCLWTTSTCLRWVVLSKVGRHIRAAV